MTDFYKTHPDGKDLPDPPKGTKPYDGWANVASPTKEKPELIPIRDTVAGKVCPLLSTIRPGGFPHKEQVKCIGADCAMYTIVHEPRYKIDPKTSQPVMEKDKDGNLTRALIEDCAFGYCAYALQTEMSYLMASKVNSINDMVSGLVRSMVMQSAAQQQVKQTQTKRPGGIKTH